MKSSNDTRAERAQTALQAYIEARGEVFENNSSEIADLIADLLHLAVRTDQGDEPVESTLRLARMHFDAEHGNPEEEEAESELSWKTYQEYLSNPANRPEGMTDSEWNAYCPSFDEWKRGRWA